MNVNKPKRTWLYLSDEDQKRLCKIVNDVESLNDATVLSILAAAALRACDEIGFMPLPLHLTVKEMPKKESAVPFEKENTAQSQKTTTPKTTRR